MKWIMDSVQMKSIDTYSINQVGIPSMVLMERAALMVTEAVKEELEQKNISFSDAKVLCVCGGGNNGADGMAVARQLSELGITAEVYPVFSEGKGTQELKAQEKILGALEIRKINQPDFSEYNCIVDALFGIGLTREIEGAYRQAVLAINEQKSQDCIVVSVDIPSGINATDGQMMGCAVKADVTVTFGYTKKGLCLYPGKQYAGNVKVRNAGFADIRFMEEVKREAAFTFEDSDILQYFDRPADANKGTFGKLLIVAGSKDMAGAAVLSAKAAYRTGCGLVKVFTHEKNRTVILNHVPEAVLVTYSESSDFKKMLEKELDWADCVVAGPGLSQSETAKTILLSIAAYQVKEKNELPVILDADALNIIAQDKEKYLGQFDKKMQCIYTPHMGEMAGLTGKEIADIKKDSCSVAEEAAKKLKGICVLKDAATVVSDGERVYINSSGNSGMATAGSGDVLTGILAGVLLQKTQNKKELYEKVCMGVYLHGRAGDFAAANYGSVGMKAMDIAENVAYVIKNL